MSRFPTLLALLGGAVMPVPTSSGPAAPVPNRGEVVAIGDAVPLSGGGRLAIDIRWNKPEIGSGARLAALIVPLAPSGTGRLPVLLRWIVVRPPAASPHRI